ncbi:MAG: hypothetical protein H8D42_03715 [Candidatus Marinimicrobia bacterium]|nr:hypothetical protein [Candidatus Neomarinimicrobiota bacterium]
MSALCSFKPWVAGSLPDSVIQAGLNRFCSDVIYVLSFFCVISDGKTGRNINRRAARQLPGLVQQAVEEGLANPLHSFASLLTASFGNFRWTCGNFRRMTGTEDEATEIVDQIEANPYE